MNETDESYILLVPGAYAEDIDDPFEYVKTLCLNMTEDNVIVADDIRDSIDIATQIPIKIIVTLTNTEEARRQIMWIFKQALRWGKIPDAKVEGIDFNSITRIIIVNGKRSRLSKIESEIMVLFMERPCRILETEFILSIIWGQNETDIALVRGAISRLRKKIEIDPDNPKWILTHDHGYSLGKC